MKSDRSKRALTGIVRIEYRINSVLLKDPKACHPRENGDPVLVF
jgi:hypothetical protein